MTDDSAISGSRRVLMIINPVSGTRSKRGLDMQLHAALRARGASLDVAVTEGPGDAARFASEAVRAGYGSVVVAAGDGTVGETAAVLCGSSTALGLIPCGSGNGLARTLGIPSDFDKAVGIAADGHTMVIDHGLVGSRHFFCTFGLGFDAAVTRSFATSRRRGRLSYVRSVFLEYLRYSPQSYAIEIGGAVITRSAFLVAVCNTSQYGNNAYIAPGASITDGLLDITVVHSGSPLETVMAGVSLLSGYLDRKTFVETIRVPAATITRLNAGIAQIDGEAVELGRRLDVSCCPASLRVLCPRRQPEFRPLVSPLRAAISDLRSDIRYFLRGE